MANVFLSYDHDDEERAAPIVSALEEAGHSVWWDRHIHGGAEYNSEIEGAVERAGVVVVLWSERSVRSAWVRDEAAEGRDQGKLVPVVLDGAKPPMGFRQFQTIPLSKWKGRKLPSQVAELLLAIEKVVGSAPVRTSVPAIERPRTRRFPVILVASAAAVVALIAIALLVWNPFAARNYAAVVAVAAGDSSRASQEHARDLLAKLGQLQSAKPDTLQLVGADARKSAGLVFEVAGGTEGQQARANVVLLDGKTAGLLWSKAFERPVSASGDLRQELVYTAAQVLDCALDAYGRPGFKAEILKVYLNGCAGLAGSSEAADLVSMFRQVVRVAPSFEGGWTKLLLADDADLTGGGDVEAANRLRRDIIAARKINPDLVQAYLAEATLLPPNAFQQRISLADHAAVLAPNQADPLISRSLALFSVGKVERAVDDARRAVEIDAISPHARQHYITILADSGRTDTALRELRQAERLWPGATNVLWTRFRTHLRYGDPRVAWEIIQSGKIGAAWYQADSFLQARLDPTEAKRRQAIDDSLRFHRNEPIYAHVVQTLGEFGTVDELLTFLNKAPFDQAAGIAQYMFQPMFRRFWRDTRSLAYAKRVGLLQYWTRSGEWPDICFERDFPYDCKKEAAKLSA